MSSAVVGGVLLGLGMLAKQPAILLPALAASGEAGRTRGSRLSERRSWVFAATSLAVAARGICSSWPLRATRLVARMTGVASVPMMSKIDAAFWTNTLGSELMWLVFPLAAVVAVAGIVIMVDRQGSGDRLVLVLLAFYLVWYIGLHKHVYYLLPITPFVALAIARGCLGPFERQYPAPRVRIIGVSALLVLMAFGSVMMLSGQKWGRWSPAGLELNPRPGASRVHLYYQPRLDNFFWSLPGAIDASLTATSSAPDAFVELPATPGVEDLYLGYLLYTPEGTTVPARENLREPGASGHLAMPSGALGVATGADLLDAVDRREDGPSPRISLDSRRDPASSIQ
jgi:hypothetical protein